MEQLFFILFSLGIIASFSFLIWARILYKKSVFETLNHSLLLIRLKKSEKELNATAPDFEKEILKSAELFTLLSSFKTSFSFEAAVPHIGEEIHFFLSVPRKFKETAERQIHSLWPSANVVESGDFNVFTPSGAVSISYLKQKYPFALPIRTFKDIGDDTFSPIISGLSRINEIGEGAAVQVVVRPVLSKKYSKNINSKIVSLKKGESLEKILSAESPFGLKDLKKAVIGEKKETINPENPEVKPPLLVDDEALKSFQEKISKPLFEVNVRVASSAPNKIQSDSIMEGIAFGFSNFSAPKKNEFKLIKPRHDKNIIFDFSFRRFNEKERMILNSEELASIFHLPTSSSDIPKINWLKSGEAEPPLNLPKEGVLLGESVFRGAKKEVFLKDVDRRRHVYAIGQTGTGKSTLLKNMAISDIRRGKGVAVIDPHGDLVNDIASLVPDERLNDVVIFNPSDFEFPVGLNMLEFNPSRPEEKTFIVNEMQSIFNKLFSQETMGPIFEQYMRNTLLLLMEDSKNEPATLIEVPRVLTDAAFRKRKLARIFNPSVVDFWTKEAEKAGGDAALENMAPYITSKFNNFIANDYLRPIIGQTKNSFDFRRLMDEGKILLVNLSKGKIGDINASLLGMIIVGKILMAALSRADVAEEKRPDFNLFIDEFQNFTTDSISVILSEARKYHLNLVMAHQFIAQLSDNIKNAVFGNVGSVLSFRVGAADAESLVKIFDPVFSARDLINIDNFRAYARILIDNQPAKAFNIKIFPSDFGNRERGEKVLELSRSIYGRPRSEIEENILKRLRS